MSHFAANYFNDAIKLSFSDENCVPIVFLYHHDRH